MLSRATDTEFPQTSPENVFLARAFDIKEHLCKKNWFTGSLLICWHEACGSIQKKYIYRENSVQYTQVFESERKM